MIRGIVNTILSKFNECKYLLKYRTTDFFNDINIEINTNCNRRCRYCPNSVYDRGSQINKKFMTENLFKKIIDELSLIKFNGRISPQFYGEPLLDERLVSLMGYVREKLPNAQIIIISNGDYLSIQLYNNLVKAGVNSFIITQHDNKMSASIKNLFLYLKNNPSKKVNITYNKINSSTSLYNRGGLIIPSKIDPIPRCRLFDNPFVIDFDGNVLLCCNDYLATIKWGNLRHTKLLDIWNDKKYVNFRKQLKRKKYTLPICKRCVGIEKI